VDPQNQANSFIKKKYELDAKETKRPLVKLNAISSKPAEDMKTLKRSIKSGAVVLFENVQELINVALEPLLNKQF